MNRRMDDVLCDGSMWHRDVWAHWWVVTGRHDHLIQEPLCSRCAAQVAETIPVHCRRPIQDGRYADADLAEVAVRLTRPGLF